MNLEKFVLWALVLAIGLAFLILVVSASG